MGCFTFFKLMTVLFNLLIFMGSLTLLAMGIWVSVAEGFFLRLLGPFSDQGLQFVNVGLFCIIIGAGLLLLGLLGCCGAHKESKCLLLTFFSIILIIFISEVAVGIVALVYSSFVYGGFLAFLHCGIALVSVWAEEIIKAWAIPALQNDYGSDPRVTNIWNTTMTELQCCGLSDHKDFVGSKFVEENGGSLPPSCCRANSAPCSPHQAERSAVQGCFKHISETLEEHGNIAGGIVAGIGILEIAAMMVSMYLYCHLDKRIN